MALLRNKGDILSRERISPFGTPKRKAGGVSTSPPAPPNDQRGGARPLLFGLSPPCSSDGAALLRSLLWLSTELQLFYFDTKSVFLMDRNFFFFRPHKMFTVLRICG